jgi:hypothetical protein
VNALPQNDSANQSELRTITIERNGKPEQIDVQVPVDASPEWMEDVAHSVQTLEDNGNIQHEPGPLKSDKTHQIETNDQGRKQLIQKRYSAV